MCHTHPAKVSFLEVNVCCCSKSSLKPCGGCHRNRSCCIDETSTGPCGEDYVLTDYFLPNRTSGGQGNSKDESSEASTEKQGRQGKQPVNSKHPVKGILHHMKYVLQVNITKLTWSTYFIWCSIPLTECISFLPGS